jgi:hypothetical protein
VADPKDSSTKFGLTRGKAILIAVLGTVLVAIVYVQFGRHEQVARGEPTAYRPPRRSGVIPAAVATKQGNVAAAAGPGAKEATPVQLIDESRWTAPELAKVTAYDPFKLPDAFPQSMRLVGNGKATGKDDLVAAAKADKAKKQAEASLKFQTRLKELKQRGVTVVMGDGDQYAAMIDDRTLHVGDKIDGFTVIAIDDENGVVIERKGSP